MTGRVSTACLRALRKDGRARGLEARPPRGAGAYGCSPATGCRFDTTAASSLCAAKRSGSRPTTESARIDRRRWESALFLKVRDEIQTGNLAIDGPKNFGRFEAVFLPAALRGS